MMMRQLLLSLWTIILLTQTAQSQIYRQQIPGTPYTVGLAPSFSPSADHEKLEDTERQMTFFMVEAPVPFEKMKTFFEAENLRKSGISLVSTETVTFNNRQALFLRTLQLQETGEVASLMLLFTDGATTLITTASYPANKPGLEPAMKTALFSVKRNQ